jgi:hypothetical protein
VSRPPPRLRWESKPVERPPIFVVPGESVGTSSVVPRGKTWGIRERGDTHKLVPHSYRCPVHGVFELRVPLSDVPDEAACTAKLDPYTDWNAERDEALRFGVTEQDDWRAVVASTALLAIQTGRPLICGLTSPWAGSTCAIGLEPGMVTG